MILFLISKNFKTKVKKITFWAELDLLPARLRFFVLKSLLLNEPIFPSTFLSSGLCPEVIYFIGDSWASDFLHSLNADPSFFTIGVSRKVPSLIPRPLSRTLGVFLINLLSRSSTMLTTLVAYLHVQFL